MAKSINVTSTGRLYSIWKGMRRRCNSPRIRNYQLYGGKGVRVCEEWQAFSVFRDWAVLNGYTDELTIDRINSNGNYCPENCRWVDRIVQNNNTSRNHFVEFDGRMMTLAQWENETGIKQNTILCRLRRGWPTERALTEGAYEINYNK